MRTTEEKQTIVLDWLDTPPAQRKPRSRSVLAQGLGIKLEVVQGWESNRSRIEIDKAMKKLASDIDVLPTDSDALLKMAVTKSKEQLAELARLKMWVIGMEGRGNSNSLTNYLKSIGDFTEKKEETFITELHKDDREYILNELKAKQEEISGRNGGEVILPQESVILLK